MLKLTSVFLFVVMFTTATMHAQTLPEPSKQNESQTNLRQAFSRETQKLKSETATLDTKKMDKMRRQVPKSNWSSKKTAFVILAAVGIAALVFVLVKYYKKCLRYEPEGCSFSSDDNCYCAEYEEENQARQPRN